MVNQEPAYYSQLETEKFVSVMYCINCTNTDTDLYFIIQQRPFIAHTTPILSSDNLPNVNVHNLNAHTNL